MRKSSSDSFKSFRERCAIFPASVTDGGRRGDPKVRMVGQSMPGCQDTHEDGKIEEEI